MNELKAELFGFMLGDGWITTKHNCGFSGDSESLQIAKNDLINIFGNKEYILLLHISQIRMPLLFY